jgi:ATP-dependent RNA helicase SUPV3L1/SUV3
MIRLRILRVGHHLLRGQIRALTDAKGTTIVEHNINEQKRDHRPSNVPSSGLHDWPGKHRLAVNRLMRVVADDADLEAEAKKLHIEGINWRNYINHYRRKLLKKPIEAVGGNENKFSTLKKLLKPLLHTDSALQINEVDGAEIAFQLSDIHDTIPEIIEAKSMVREYMLQDAQEQYESSIAARKALVSHSDLRSPSESYPGARITRRKIIYHGGPTNSGKTYEALQRLKQADPAKGGGLYCGPLRLLALEVYESLNREGVYADLLTGQEQRSVPFSTHVSSTLEMVNLSREYDVAVVDEIQMIGDEQRGYAWTRALLGLRAREIHICGGIEALEVVKRLLEDTDDEFELKSYDRLGELRISDESLKGDYTLVRPGDCIVAFSRADIFSIKRQVEALTKYKCSTIYGGLPPETRSEQARMFNEERTDILVASDAIGMGLNLNIGRIIFHTTVKKGMDSPYFIDPSNIKQIAGRAGRLSSKYKIGEVTAWQEADLAYVKSVMQYDIPYLERAGLFPSMEHMELFSQQLRQLRDSQDEQAEKEAAELAAEVEAETTDGPGSASKKKKKNSKKNANVQKSEQSLVPIVPVASVKSNGISEKNVRLSALLERFVELSQVDGRFFLCDHADMALVSNWLHSIPMTLADRFVFANAPVSTRNMNSMNVLYQFASQYAQGRPVALNVRLNKRSPENVKELDLLCERHNSLDLYVWLSFRFPKYFVEREKALEQKEHAVRQIQRSLGIALQQEKYSHSDSHAKTHMKLRKKTGDGLPPQQYGNVRNTMRQLLSDVPSDSLTLYPRKHTEGAPPGSLPSK